MKTNDLLIAEIEALNNKLAELTEEEQRIVLGGIDFGEHKSAALESNRIVSDNYIEGGIIDNNG